MRTLSGKVMKMLPESFGEQMTLQVNPAEDFQATVHPIFFSNIITNLVKNASMHGQARKIEIGCRAATRELYVKDDGKGIPPHVEPYVFNMYYSTGSTRIGLPFIRQLIESMGGSIRFETSTQGTTFWIRFPEPLA